MSEHPSATSSRRTDLVVLFNAAVQAAHPAHVIARNLPAPHRGRTIVIGAGKASAQMAAAFDAAWSGPLEGVVVTRYGHACPAGRIEVIEAAHPVPDAAGEMAARRVRAAVEGLTEDDLVVALISGGGSALLPAPLGGMTLADEIALNQALLASGAPIAAMNTIRKQVSAIKGGRLAAAAHPAHMVSLIISDVPGDDPARIASGPTVPDTTTRAQARELVARHKIGLTPATRAVLAGDADQPPLPADPVFARNDVRIIASAALSLQAAASLARQKGYDAEILSDAIEGEAREVGAAHAALVLSRAAARKPGGKPLLLLSGGETTVTVTGAGGRGGRNGEFLLAFALGIAGEKRISALAADTDGIDGTEDNAGAFADGRSVQRMRAAGLDPQAALAAHDSYRAFQAIGDLFVPGPTGTNVNDFRAMLID